jgi:hypothetical protein
MLGDSITHFMDEDDYTRTLCGQRVVAIVMGNDPKARCPLCQDLHANEGWTFPLPATVAVTQV